ncbi:MAG: S8 family serine peptidase [Verrucomicrobiaceae bacterium]|nr:S8 family serine peptidase [Verrucomicrobiaceae bacterium]
MPIQLKTNISRHFLAGMFAVVVAGHAFGQPTTQYVEGEVLVTFKKTASETKSRAVVAKRAMTMARHFKGLSKFKQKQTGLIRAKAKTTQQLIAELSADPDVESVEPNYIRRPFGLPSDPRFTEMWGLNNSGQTVNGTVGTPGADISYVEAFRRARTSTARPIVAVIDTGVDHTHPDLKDNIWINSQELVNGSIIDNGIDDDGNGYKDDIFGYDFANGENIPVDAGTHGTHVSGTIAAVADNALGIAGVSRNAQIMALRVAATGGTIDTAAFIDALEYTVAMKNRGEPIVAINASFGGPNDSVNELQAIQATANAGILFIAAAGNDGSNNDVVNVYPANYRLENMIVVAASTQNDQLASFSNYGFDRVDLAAPGTNILSVKPTVLTLTAGGTAYPSNTMTFSGEVLSLSGTVIDCGIGGVGDFPPTVSGNVALIERGGLTFANKVTNAMAAGAIAALIYNDVTPGNYLGTLITPGSWVPVRSLSRSDGLAIKAALPLSAQVGMEQGFHFLNGTSMATPHVAAAVTLAALCYPNENSSVRKVRILSAVDQKPAFAGKTATGGRLNLLKVIDPNLSGNQPWPYIPGNEQLPGAALGAAYSYTPTVTGGAAPYTFMLDSGTLPSGLTISSSGLISGTPSAIGTSTFNLLVSDSNGPGATQSFTIVTVADPLVIQTSPTLSDGDVGANFTKTLTASGGTAPYTWTLNSGTLPPGLSLSSDGTLSGLPFESGNFIFIIQATDFHGMTATKEFSIQVSASPINTGPDSLFSGVVGVMYQQSLVAVGGSGSKSWVLANGSLPPGVTLSSSGSLSGTPTMSGTYEGVFRVSDTALNVGALAFRIVITSSFVKPIIEPINWSPVYIGTLFSYPLAARNYPSSFKVLGLPKGLSYSTRTGLISGRPTLTGTFAVIVSASNTAGTGNAVTVPLTIRDIETGRLGSFSGLVSRNTAVNADLGSRVSLTTTSTGAFTLVVTTGSTKRSASGSLGGTAPQISTNINGHILELTFDSLTQTFTGNHGGAAVSGYKHFWHSSVRPAMTRAGYYSAALDPQSSAAEIPQGSGFIALTIAPSGAISISGKTADAQSIATSCGMGPTGQFILHQSLYGHRASLSGTLNVSEAISPADNAVSGQLSWMKPDTASKAYAIGFNPTLLNTDGKYLSAKSGVGIILGLPNPGDGSLRFVGAKVDESDVNPDVPFSCSPVYTLSLPSFNTGFNPGKTALKFNRSTGLFSGEFILQENSLQLRRTGKFSGVIVRRSASADLSAGYFLLPQIPTLGQPASSAPILSGKAILTQP